MRTTLSCPLQLDLVAVVVVFTVMVAGTLLSLWSSVETRSHKSDLELI